MTQTAQTTADLTARRDRLETRRAELERQLIDAEAALETLHRDDSVPVATLIGAQTDFAAVSGTLERTERDLAEVTAQLVTAESVAAREAGLAKLEATLRAIQTERAGFTAVLERASQHMLEDLEPTVMHRQTLRQLHHELHALLNTVSPGHSFHLASFNRASNEQVRAAEAREKDFAARGLDLRDAYEGGAAFPEPFGELFSALLDAVAWQASTTEVSK